MRTQTFILFPNDRSWRIGAPESGKQSFHEVPLPPADSAEEIAETIFEALKKHGWRNQPVAMALPTSWCLCCALASEEPSSRNGRQAMLYKFEEELPLEAEQIAADFLEIDRRTTLAVATPLDGLQEIVQFLQASGVELAMICPRSLMALRNMIDHLPECDALAWEEANCAEAIFLRNRKPAAWYSASDMEHLGVYLRAQAAPRLRVALLKTGGEFRRPDISGIEWLETPAEGTLQLDDEAARAAENPRMEPWIDFTRGGLAPGVVWAAVRKPLFSALIAAALLVITICGGILWRASRYDRIAGAEQDQQHAIFTRLFPGRAVPVDIAARLASEKRRLDATKDRVANGARPNAALYLLHDLLADLPHGVRCRASELRLADGQLYFEGQVTNRPDADAIAASLRHIGGLTIDPPQTEQVGPDEVGFVITGSAAPGAGAGQSSVESPDAGAEWAQPESISR